LPKGPKGEKRPADVVGAAVKVMRIATSEIEEGINVGGMGLSRCSITLHSREEHHEVLV
jgi:hypothetical protein